MEKEKEKRQLTTIIVRRNKAYGSEPGEGL